ncbi:hypothetical protein V492_05671 [Pseudogymnoascus sp. VKM F-4246]|nr:hypothetical protein V492_05671 [Pseudogymnoascus sp. VKM F-4246]
MFSLSFSQTLLVAGIIFWLVCLGADLTVGLRQTPAVDPTATLCFFGAVAASFVAGAMYGHEAEFEKAQRGKYPREDPMAQPLLDSEKDERASFDGMIC